jgi:hypothetical protein
MVVFAFFLREFAQFSDRLQFYIFRADPIRLTEFPPSAVLFDMLDVKKVNYRKLVELAREAGVVTITHPKVSNKHY